MRRVPRFRTCSTWIWSLKCSSSVCVALIGSHYIRSVVLSLRTGCLTYFFKKYKYSAACPTQFTLSTVQGTWWEASDRIFQCMKENPFCGFRGAPTKIFSISCGFQQFCHRLNKGVTGISGSATVIGSTLLTLDMNNRSNKREKFNFAFTIDQCTLIVIADPSEFSLSVISYSFMYILVLLEEMSGKFATVHYIPNLLWLRCWEQHEIL